MYEITFDIETTGLDLLKDIPIQVGAVVHQVGRKTGDRETALAEVLWHTVAPHPLPAIITKITGLTNKILQEKGYTPSLSAKKWHELVWKYQPAILIGYNLINFDFPMLSNFLSTYTPGRFKHPPVFQILDVMHMASVYFHTRKWIKLSECAKRLGIPFDKELLHTALEDAILTQKCYVKMLPAFI